MMAQTNIDKIPCLKERAHILHYLYASQTSTIIISVDKKLFEGMTKRKKRGGREKSRKDKVNQLYNTKGFK